MKIDLEAVQTEIVTRLPVRARWTINRTPLDYNFVVAHESLYEVSDDLLCMVGPAEKEWFELLIFGDYDYAEGGGAHPWLCVRKSDGAIYGLDVERENAAFLLNSSLEGFIGTFQFLNGYFGNAKQLPSNVNAHLRRINPEAYPESDWRLLINCIRAGDL